MRLSEFKHALEQITEIFFQKEDGTKIPTHFHITEVGKVTKNFIDCGGVVREQSCINLQLWESIDVWHRLSTEKLRSIISLSESKLNLTDEEIEVEYQGNTIEKYGLEFQNGLFVLTHTKTDCLASDQCGIPEKSESLHITTTSCCPPGGGCC